GDDTITVGSATSSLADIAGALTINGQAGNDTLLFNDVAAVGGVNYTLTATTLNRSGAALITFGTIESLTLTGGNNGNIITVASTPAAVPVTVNAGNGNDTVNVQAIAAALTVNGQGGNDTINVGNAANVLDSIAGTLTVNGDAGTNTVNVNDQGTGGPRTYTV